MPDLLEIGASFDIFTPIYSVVRGLLEGPSHTFLIPADQSPLSGREIGWLLGKKGVKAWGLVVVGGTLMVSVRLSQARWAQHLLESAGVPIENPVAGGEKKRRPKASKAQPSAKGWTCSHCGNWYEKRPTTCKGCGGNYFVGWR